MSRLRVIFMGTPEFSVPSLEKLSQNYDVIAVVTQPDRPRGRGHKLAESPVKQAALKLGLKVYQPERIKTPEFENILANLHPDLIVVVAFGQILSKRILTTPPLGCINVHASLLPRYRGAAPIHWAIVNGEKVSGVTTMFMDIGLDTGDMILKKEVEISKEMTTGELHDRLMTLGADLLIETIESIQFKTDIRIKQDDTKSNYAPLLTKKIEQINWSLSAERIHDLIRGLNPWPGAFCLFDDKVFKIWKTKIYNSEKISITKQAPGTIIEFTKNGFIVITGTGLLEVLEIQPAGKRRMLAKDYVCGHGLKIGDKFDDVGV
ncbi:methionyl-tRNA formyltransferase [Anaerosinus massiliensis]|uniref:methionyl-tRNA formyltransferase n=1 Tax=Massilibacillus massiliensis TaxID=1806837 RepID=UPI000A8E02D6|nr:methionyl-tRNA formyltransferase [Massilibacillus massiliensis]